MYVRKFEADTLEDALKNIKRELGPDAIVLKTVTNKGLKGAFKKKRIEITAAISEKNYTKKSKVDSVLNEEQKDGFYQSSSEFVSGQIDTFVNHADKQEEKKSGYGSLALNRPVKSKQNKQLTNSLDDFLKDDIKASLSETTPKLPPSPLATNDFNDQLHEASSHRQAISDRPQMSRDEVESKVAVPVRYQAKEEGKQHLQLINDQNDKIAFLERKINELTSIIEQSYEKADKGILTELHNKLKALGISEEYVQRLIKKISFEFDNSEDDFEEVLDYALNIMMESLRVKLPLFSGNETDGAASITILASDGSSGQTTMCQKISSMCPHSQIVYYKGEDESKSFSDSLLSTNIKHVSCSSEIVTTCRKNMSEGVSTIVDFKGNLEDESFKKFIKGLRRCFDRVEVLTTISAIKSQVSNERTLNRYQDVSDGIIVNYIDQCLDFGMLFNLGDRFQDNPFVFFGNGDVVPHDVEPATAERILAGMFKL